MAMHSEEVRPLLRKQTGLRDSIPVSILTGFLGSGKTTVVNYILGSDHGLKVAVIVNEFGDISIDDKLISNRAENIIELANGCVCCTMQGDLLRTLCQVTSATPGIDYVLLETSGLSDPLPVANSILNKLLGDSVRLDGIITVIDALNFDANLACAEVAFNQLVYGDLILINKIDLVEAHIPGLIKRGVRKINPNARMLTCIDGKIDPLLLLDVNIANVREITNKASEHATGLNRHDASAFDCMPFESAKPFDPELFKSLVANLPVDIYRGKGILNVVNEDCEHVFHLVGDRCTVTKGKPWIQGDGRRTRLVLIGRNLNKAGLLGELKSCLI
jgi:G3E family GTPase